MKSLAKSETPKWAELRRTEVAPRIQTVGCVFAFESSLTMATLASHYVEEVRSRGLGHHIDLILVLDRGIITLAIKPPGDEWGPVILDVARDPKAYEGLQFAAAIHEIGKNSLDAFLRHLLLPMMNFRPLVPHPGFDWNPPHLGDGISSIHRIVQEADRSAAPRKMSKKEHAAEVAEDLKSRPAPARRLA